MDYFFIKVSFSFVKFEKNFYILKHCVLKKSFYDTLVYVTSQNIKGIEIGDSEWLNF